MSKTAITAREGAPDVPAEASVAGSARIESPALARPSVENDYALPVNGFIGTPEQIERQWFELVYTGRGDRMRQLTLRRSARLLRN